MQRVMAPLCYAGQKTRIKCVHNMALRAGQQQRMREAPKQDDSGDTRKQLRITKAGDQLMRRLLVGSAHYILGPKGPDCDLRFWGLELAKRGGKNAKKRAACAVARKLAVLLHSLWKTGEVYEPLRHASRSSARQGQVA